MGMGGRPLIRAVTCSPHRAKWNARPYVERLTRISLRSSGLRVLCFANLLYGFKPQPRSQVSETQTTTSKELLLSICADKQGEHLGAGHPKTSWATRYGDEFVEAAAGLYLIYRRTSNYPEYAISRAFIGAGVMSCRGAKMDQKRVAYLIRTHIHPFLQSRKLL